jgi:processive 1,2-diacylglycerol beta-glucosyltransferase
MAIISEVNSKKKRILQDMKKILILPFLQLPSGHHQVADALSAYLKEIDDSFNIQSVDIFHYTSRHIEHATSKLYLQAIKVIPSIYSWLYRFNACRRGNDTTDKRYLFYELFFLQSLKKLISEVNPDLIICTHCLPSYLLNLLKMKKELSIPVINAYTDFFINTVWGNSHIDLHLVPREAMKYFLEQRNVSSEKIAVTGIPVHPVFTPSPQKRYEERKKPPFDVLVSGGSLGVGSIDKIFARNHFTEKINYRLLCGRNQQLFQKIKMLRNPYLQPIPYIRSREEMNNLYERTDIMVSKPGGITVSECHRKGIPIGLLDALPGQEELNEKYLLKEKLAIKINVSDFENSLLSFLENESEKQTFNKRIGDFTNQHKELRMVLKMFMEQ